MKYRKSKPYIINFNVNIPKLNITMYSINKILQVKIVQVSQGEAVVNTPIGLAFVCVVFIVPSIKALVCLISGMR